jgi:hypothetical protein
MPTDKPRITIQLEPELYNVLNAIATKSRVSIGSLIRSAVLCKMDDFLAFDAYLDNLPPTGMQRIEAIEALKSPGPHSLKADLERISKRYGSDV